MTATATKDAASSAAAAWASAILIALLVMFTGLALFQSGAGIFFRVPQNFNEGWNAYFARAAYEGPLYFPYEAAITNNYPPLSFYLIGGLSRLGGDPIYIGRLLSAAALLAVAINIYAALRTFAVDRPMAASVGIAFLGFMAIGLPDYIATNDPQWLAHAVMMTGFTVFLRGYPRGGALTAAALLMLAAGMIKHTLLPLPQAVTVWLFLYDRPRFRLWLTVCVAGGAAAVALIWALHGTVALEAILVQKRQYRLLQVANALYQHVAPTIPLLALFFVSGAPLDKRTRLLVLHAAFALVWDVYTMSAIGVAENGILDYHIAVALLAGLALGRLAAMSRVYALAAITLPLIVVACNLPKPHRVWQWYQTLESGFKEDEALVRSHAGPAMCSTSALCYWAGKTFEYDPFNTWVKMTVNPEHRADVVKKVHEKYFAIAQIYNLDQLPAEVAAAIRQEYVMFHTSTTGRKYYRPK
jgi:hypothetical protein